MSDSNNNDESVPKFAVIVAGGNGSGKTKLIKDQILPRFDSVGFDIAFINADIWQKEKFGTFTEDIEHAKAAAQWAEKERQKFINEGKSFIAETVFSHPSKIDLIKEAKNKGFFVSLYHIHLDSPDLAIERIQNRVLLGGHSVDDEKVRNRYKRVIPLIAEASKYADQTFVFDNSVRNEPHSLVMDLSFGRIDEIYRDLPEWVTFGYDKQLKAHYNIVNDSSLIENLKNTKNGDEMSLIKEKLGFEWNPDLFPKEIPTYHRSHVLNNFEKNIVNHIHGSAAVADNSFKPDEIKELLKGRSVAGHTVIEQDQAIGLIDGALVLANAVRNNTFKLDKTNYLAINEKIAFSDSIEAGVFRGEGQEISFTPNVGVRHNITHKPIKTDEDAPALNKQFKEGVEVINSLKNPLEKGMATFLFGSLNQFTFEGEKRTAHLMMNGVLMNAGLEAINIPPERAIEFRKNMVDFYQTKNSDKMMNFLLECYPDRENIKNLEKDKNHKIENSIIRSM